MAAAKTNVGIMKCEGSDDSGKPCGHDVMVKQNEAGTLTYQCGLGCDVSSFAKRGTKAQERWRAKIAASAGKLPKEVQKVVPEPQEKALPAPSATPPVPLPKAKPAGPFDFLSKGSAAA